MINLRIKSAILALPIMTACGAHDSTDKTDEKPKASVETQVAAPKGLALTRLGNLILTTSLTRGVLPFEEYQGLVENRTAIVIEGKHRSYVSFDELASRGIYKVDDAIQDGGWLEEFESADLADEIRQIAYANDLITRSELRFYRRGKMVPTFRHWIRFDVHEKELLQHWIIDAHAAFEGGIMRQRTGEELRSSKELKEIG